MSAALTRENPFAAPTDDALETGFVRVKLTRKGHGYRGARENSEVVLYHTEAKNLIDTEMATVVQTSKARKEPWRRVEVIAGEGTQFGVVSDSDGVLKIAVRHKDQSWPAGDTEVPQSGFNEILEGNTAYVIESDGK